MGAGKDAIALISGFRKIILAGIALGLIVGLCIVVLTIFLVNWYLGGSLITGKNLIDLYIEAFKYSATIAGSYMAANVCVKAVTQWLTKKKG